MHGPGLMTSGQTKINGKSKYNRILIRRRKPVGENADTPAFTVERERVVPYFRVLVRRK